MPKAEGKRASAAKGLDTRSFEEVLRRLEEVVDGLEGGDLSVEKSLALFEEGVTLAREGHRRLEAAERRITVLLEEGGERPLDLDAGDDAGRGEPRTGPGDDEDGDDEGEEE